MGARGDAVVGAIRYRPSRGQGEVDGGGGCGQGWEVTFQREIYEDSYAGTASDNSTTNQN